MKSEFYRYVLLESKDGVLCDCQYLDTGHFFFQWFKDIDCDFEFALRLIETIDPDEKYLTLRNEAIIVCHYNFVKMLFEYKERITFFVCSDYKIFEYRQTHAVDNRLNVLRSFWQAYKTPEDYPIFDATDALVRL